MSAKILFVSHDASRSGAPIVLLHLLRWLKKNAEIEMTILLKRGGDLSEDFNSLAPCYIWHDEKKKNILKRIFGKFFLRHKKINYDQYRLLTKVKAKKFDLVYTNTIESHDLITILKPYLVVPFVSHIHENEYSCKSPRYVNRMKKEVLNEIIHFIAVSKSTKDNLIDNYGIEPSAISLFYEFVPVDKINVPKRSVDEVKAELGIDNEFIIGSCGGACGITGWRKGVDYFINLAFTISNLSPETKVRFIWVGHVDADFLSSFEYEKYRLGIGDKVIFTGVKTNVADYFQLFDVFALTSREDPFPLVCLEAASLSKPIICFEKAGGIPEFIEKGGGWSIPYGNMDVMAKKILEIVNDKELIAQKGGKARECVKEYDVNVIAPRIHDCINEIINKERLKL